MELKCTVLDVPNDKNNVTFQTMLQKQYVLALMSKEDNKNQSQVKSLKSSKTQVF